jgi:hypothetical protein
MNSSHLHYYQKNKIHKAEEKNAWTIYSPLGVGTNKKVINLQSQREAFTLAAWPFGLGNELGQSSSLIRLGSVGGVGVKGWKLVVGVNEEPGGVDSNSLWRSLILCRSSFKYSMASPRIEALSICKHKYNIHQIILSSWSTTNNKKLKKHLLCWSYEQPCGPSFT